MNPPIASSEPRAGLQFVRTLSPPPIAELLGFRMVEADDGEVSFAMPIDGRFANPMGTLHGGVICDLGDAAMGCAMATTLDEGETFTTIELKVNFFKPVFRGELVATAKMVRRSRTLGYLECDVIDEKKTLVARLASTCMVLRGDAAKGR